MFSACKLVCWPSELIYYTISLWTLRTLESISISVTILILSRFGLILSLFGYWSKNSNLHRPKCNCFNLNCWFTNPGRCFWKFQHGLYCWPTYQTDICKNNYIIFEILFELIHLPLENLQGNLLKPYSPNEVMNIFCLAWLSTRFGFHPHSPALSSLENIELQFYVILTKKVRNCDHVLLLSLFIFGESQVQVAKAFPNSSGCNLMLFK